MFESIFSDSVSSISIISALICMGVALALGIIIAITHMHSEKYSKNFIITLAVLPLLVEIVILMVNGNLGTSVAVLGAFSLVRFRSMPGTSREIISIFWAMAIGLAVGMGHILFATITTIAVAITLIVFDKVKFGQKKANEKILKITIPESLDYDNLFDEVLKKFTKKYSIEKVKTTNMGSMFEIMYNIIIEKDVNEKDFIDEIRCRNGNLTVSLSRAVDTISTEL